MNSKLQNELKQTKPFRLLEEEVTLNIVRTAEYLASEAAKLFKSVDLTATQYNVLRILRGAEGEGLSCGEISERMVTKEPDVTRLLDRIENRGYLTRERPANNRRVVIVRITDEGLKILSELDEPIDALNIKLIGHLGTDQQQQLIELLEAIRSN